VLFTIKRPKSQRFFQLSFRGFAPRGRNRIEQFVNSWAEFFQALRGYFIRKLKLLIVLLGKIALWLFALPQRFKSFLIKKLIWSRGKLGRSVATVSVMGAAFGVFLFGEVFSSSTLVVDKKVEGDYLVSASDIIPRREVATTVVPEIRKRSEPTAYAVQEGDTLSSIGARFKISVDALKYVNNLTDYTTLKVGEQITIPPASGLVHAVAVGDTLTSIAEKYEVAPQAIADFNYILDTSKLAVGTELVIPGGKIPEPVIPITPEFGIPSRGQYAAVSPNKGLCVWPTTVRIISQYFTWYHNGVDIASPIGGAMPPLLSCMDGKVIRAGWDPFGLGLHVRIDHGNGYETVYGHMSKIDVGYGQKVKRGQIIGLMGNTGRSTGPHVHFIVKYNGMALDPLNFTR
jgi:murein DD-endopeptidase MepM/ murein hydrolase activator NlpD